ncbi:F-box protein skip16 [Asimina triloba]
MELESLEDLVIHSILTKLGPQEAAAIACLSRRLRVLASDEQLWRLFCFRDLDLSSPQDPSGNPLGSFKAYYSRFTLLLHLISIVSEFQRLVYSSQTLLVLFPSMQCARTFQKGASEAKLNEVEDKLGLKLPVATRVLYRFCDGQEIPQASSVPLLGLIGGYSFYNHMVNVYLLPLSRVVNETRMLESQLGLLTGSQYILVAASIYDEKLFFLDCANGQLFVGTTKLARNGHMIRCVPDALIRSVHDVTSDLPQDAMLLWLEEHGRRLQSGMMRVHDEGGIRSLSLFPETLPYCSTAVTNGVQVRASAVFVPELYNYPKKNKYVFSYSIRMRLLPQGCMLDGVCHQSCQLYWRHWIIHANDTVVSEVSDAAVIGKHPLLYLDGEEFVYESCSSIPASGTIEGDFTFVPGRLDSPKGRKFDVVVAQFPLEVPEYVF